MNHLTTHKKSYNSHNFDMKPILDQERLFFELTKAIMNDKDTRQINLREMEGTTKHAYEFMRRMLGRYGGGQVNALEDRLLNLYGLTCKIEMVV